MQVQLIGGANIITRVLRRGRHVLESEREDKRIEGEVRGKMLHCFLWRQSKGPWAKENRQLLEYEKVKETILP